MIMITNKSTKTLKKEICNIANLKYLGENANDEKSFIQKKAERKKWDF